MTRRLIIIVAVAFCILLFLIAGAGTFVAAYYLARSAMSGNGSGNDEPRVTMPQKERANPANPKEYQSYITLTVTDVDSFAIHGRRGSKTDLPTLLREALRDLGDVSADDCRVVIRARGSTSTGTLQEVIKICQDEGLGQFAIRDQRE